MYQGFFFFFFQWCELLSLIETQIYKYTVYVYEMLNRRKKCFVFILNCWRKWWSWTVFWTTHMAELLHTQLIFNHKVCCSCSTDRTHATVMAVFNYIHACICFFRFSPLNWWRNENWLVGLIYILFASSFCVSVETSKTVLGSVFGFFSQPGGENDGNIAYTSVK